MTRARIDLLGLEIDRVTEAETVAAVLGGLANGRGGWVITPNLDHLGHITRRPELAELFARADLVVADGTPLVWASRLQGTPLPERVAGSELVWSLTAESALRGRSMFLLGGAPGACEAALQKLRALYPGARFAGTLCPPRGFERDSDQIEGIRRALKEAKPDIVYVALPFPKQERLIAYLRGELPHAWFLGVGFALSFVADESARAPDWMMRIGLEWLHRLAREPRRLARRYLVQGLPSAARLFARALWSRFRGRDRYVHAAELMPLDAGDRVVFAYGRVERARAQLLGDLMEPE